jgi:acetyl esterase/lipase
MKRAGPAVAVLSCAVLLAGVASGQNESLAERFDRVDKDGDGKVTKEELPRPLIFERLDKNGDGVIERGELPVGLVRKVGADAVPEGVTVKRDVAYGDDPAQKLDIYQSEAKKKGPVMVYVHGGGWRRGDKGRVGEKVDFFSDRGWLFVSINYRLLPKGKHPVNVDDVARAVAWVHHHAEEHGGDPARLFVMGHSAGAHLAALVATRKESLEKAGKSLKIVKGVIPLDTNAYDLPELMSGRAKTFYQPMFGDDPEVLKDASPSHHVAKGKDIAPFLICFSKGMRAQADAGRSERANAFAEKLRAAGVEATVVDASDRNHGEINAWFGRDDDKKVTGAAVRFLEGVSEAEEE